MKHACVMLWGLPHDGTPGNLARAAFQDMARRMPTLMASSRFTHQGEGADSYDVMEWGESQRWFDASSEADHRNCALAWARANWNPDRVWFVDADEFYSDEHFERLKKVVETSEADAWFVRRYAYWKSLDWRIDPIEPSPALLALDPKKVVAFEWGRRAYSKKNLLVEGPIQHHATAVRSDEETLKKWKTFLHAKEMVPGWYEKVWKAWQPSMTDLHPTHPSCWKRAIPVDEKDLPPVLCDLAPVFRLQTVGA